jgi:hypothetical protein
MLLRSGDSVLHHLDDGPVLSHLGLQKLTGFPFFKHGFGNKLTFAALPLVCSGDPLFVCQEFRNIGSAAVGWIPWVSGILTSCPRIYSEVPNGISIARSLTMCWFVSSAVSNNGCDYHSCMKFNSIIVFFRFEVIIV